MYLFLLKLFTIKSYAHINIFRKNKRNLEDLITKHRKIKQDISFIEKYNQEDLIPTFVTVHLAIKHWIK